MMNWGRNLKKLRMEHNWTQADLAALFGYNQSSIGHMERGRYDSLKQSLLEKLAKAWDMSVAELSSKLYAGVSSNENIGIDTGTEIIKSVEQVKEMIRNMGASVDLNEAQVAFSGGAGEGLTEEDVRALVDMAELLRKKNKNDDRIKRT